MLLPAQTQTVAIFWNPECVDVLSIADAFGFKGVVGESKGKEMYDWAHGQGGFSFVEKVFHTGKLISMLQSMVLRAINLRRIRSPIAFRPSAGDSHDNQVGRLKVLRCWLGYQHEIDITVN